MKYARLNIAQTPENMESERRGETLSARNSSLRTCLRGFPLGIAGDRQSRSCHINLKSFTISVMYWGQFLRCIPSGKKRRRTTGSRCASILGKFHRKPRVLRNRFCSGSPLATRMPGERQCFNLRFSRHRNFKPDSSPYV